MRILSTNKVLTLFASKFTGKKFRPLVSYDQYDYYPGRTFLGKRRYFSSIVA